jgi:leucyl aminopeptidase (aminopeptidase T)
MDELTQAVEAVVGRCLGVAAGERVVVVADSGTRAIGEAMREAASRAGADAVLTLMDPREVDGQEPPDAVAAALSACDVFIGPTTASFSHTRARKAASENGARGATLPGVTEDLLARLMAADLGAIKRRSDAVAELLTRHDSAHFTCPRGSDFTTNLAELGVGTNERATLTGRVLEDEKMLGTVHVAFGASMAIGGTVSVPVHLDSVVIQPTLEVGGTRVIEDGRFLL